MLEIFNVVKQSKSAKPFFKMFKLFIENVSQKVYLKYDQIKLRENLDFLRKATENMRQQKGKNFQLSVNKIHVLISQ